MIVVGVELCQFTPACAMPSLLFPRPAVSVAAECELLSLPSLDKASSSKDGQQHKLGKSDEDNRRSELIDLAASYVPPFITSFERSASHPTALSSFSSSLSCLSLVSSLFDRSSTASFWPALPRSRSGLASYAHSPPPPPPSAYLFESDDDSDSDSSFDSDSDPDTPRGERVHRAVDEVELFEYCKPTSRDSPPPHPTTHYDAAAEPTSIPVSRDSCAPSTLPSPGPSPSVSLNTSDSNRAVFDWLRAWHSELTCHMRQREADRRKKRRTLRSALLIDDDECCHTQLGDDHLTLTSRYRHMMITINISQHHDSTTPAPSLSGGLCVSADIYLPQLASTFASFQAHASSRRRSTVRSTFPFGGLTQSASFSSTHPRSPDTLSHPLARSSSSVGLMHPRLDTTTTMHSPPPLLPFIRSHLWPLLLDFMQPATHEQSTPLQAAYSGSLEGDERMRRQVEASEARLAERESRWQEEIRRMEERDRRETGKENRAANTDRRRGRTRERGGKTEARQARARKRTIDE